MVESKLRYEECRRQRLEENKKRMEELNLGKLAQPLKALSPKSPPVGFLFISWIRFLGVEAFMLLILLFVLLVVLKGEAGEAQTSSAFGTEKVHQSCRQASSQLQGGQFSVSVSVSLISLNPDHHAFIESKLKNTGCKYK